MKTNRNDIFLLDRGFRVCGDFLREKGFTVKMPEFIQKTDSSGQLSTDKANKIATCNGMSLCR